MANVAIEQSLESSCISAQNSALLGNLPHLTSIHLWWTCVVEDVMQYLINSPYACPELEVVRVKVTLDTGDRIFALVLTLANCRHTTKQPLHHVECSVGETCEGEALSPANHHPLLQRQHKNNGTHWYKISSSKNIFNIQGKGNFSWCIITPLMEPLTI